MKFPRPSILKYPYIPWQLKQRPDGDRPHLPASSFLVQEHSHSPSAAIPPTQAQRRERLYIATVSSTPHAWPYNYKYLALQQHLRCFNLKDKEDQLPEILQKLINSDCSQEYFKQVMGCCSAIHLKFHPAWKYSWHLQLQTSCCSHAWLEGISTSVLQKRHCNGVSPANQKLNLLFLLV